MRTLGVCICLAILVAKCDKIDRARCVDPSGVADLPAEVRRDLVANHLHNDTTDCGIQVQPAVKVVYPATFKMVGVPFKRYRWIRASTAEQIDPLRGLESLFPEDFRWVVPVYYDGHLYQVHEYYREKGATHWRWFGCTMHKPGLENGRADVLVAKVWYERSGHRPVFIGWDSPCDNYFYSNPDSLPYNLTGIPLRAEHITLDVFELWPLSKGIETMRSHMVTCPFHHNAVGEER